MAKPVATQDAPIDRGCLVGICFFILGLGTLLPWNFFVTASSYFEKRLNTTSVVNGTLVEGEKYYFKSWMTLLSQLPLLVFTLLNSFLYQRVSEGMRIAGSLVCILLLFILTTVLVVVPMGVDRLYSFTMAIIWFINSFGAVLQGSLFGLVGQLPQKYSAVFMSGQGLAGTFAAIAMLISIASKPKSETEALGYFITPCVGTLLTLFSYLLLYRLEFAQYYLNKNVKYEAGATDELLTEGSAVENGKLNGHANGSVSSEPPKVVIVGKSDQELSSDQTKQAFLSLEQVEKNQAKSSVLEVFKKIWVMAFCVTFVFTVTLSVFPAVTADVQTSSNLENWKLYFTAVSCFLIFNINDWLGRTVTTFIQWPKKDSKLFPLLVTCRVVFIPLLMLCNIENRHYLPNYFTHDVAFCIIMAIFSFSSGYFVCLSMSYAPQLVEPKDSETAGALMTFFLALGLSIGAALSFPLRALV